MQIKIKEVVANYILDLFGHTVQARITKDINDSGNYLWDISHYSVEEGFRPKKPAPVPTKTIEDALQQIMDYAKVHSSGYSPRENADF
ncbi:hypothetical protein [Pseudomonas baetica]|uniref:hypothetical protein n=1 Tax=Pseudomonas baetica TaxID=674054 RepID=UPI0024072B70|nr:hypothetical protein [Pseudomonas baetica]MDF9778017.1 hypothetical protein [Pseudomonas baetica]